MVSHAAKLKTYRFSGTLLSRFVMRRALWGAILTSVIFCSFFSIKAIGYAKLYPSVIQRVELASSFNNNVGIKAIFGIPSHLDSIAGYLDWNTLPVMALIGCIWGGLLAVSKFRGEEQSGHTEYFLVGKSTNMRATLNIFGGLGGLLLVIFLVCGSVFEMVGRKYIVDLGAEPFFLLSLTVSLTIALFMLLGAFASQLYATRAQAASFVVAIIAASFLLKAAGSVTTSDWLLSVTPFGWADKVQPLAEHNLLWLLLITIVCLILGIATVLLSRRDLGQSVFADRDTARPYYWFLRSPLLASARLTLPKNIGWILTIGGVGLAFGSMTKAAVDAFTGSAGTQRVIQDISGRLHSAGAKTFLGVVFMITIILIMSYVANAVSAIRGDEAEGYLDNLLVRRVGRVRWIMGRVSIIIITLLLMASILTLALWVTISGQSFGITLHDIYMACLNALIPASLVLSIGLFVFGVTPRLTAIVTYGVIGWSFLIQMLSSGLKLDDWVLSTSIFHYVVIAPAGNPDWHKNFIGLGISGVLAVISIIMFNRRDLQAE